MSLRAFNSGANVIAYVKNNHKYAMTCAWSTMLDYDKIGMLLGSQSITGKNLAIGDIVGVSSLSKEQKDVALIIGDGHSDKIDKFINIPFSIKNTAILVQNAKVNMVCKVTQLLHLFEDSDDIFVVLDVIEHSDDKNKLFISLDEVFPE